MNSKSVTMIISSTILVLGMISAQDKADITKQPDPPNSYYTLWNINNLSGWIRNDGFSARQPGIGTHPQYGITFPRSTVDAVWTDGIVWGGLVDDGDPSTPQLRVGGRDYWVGTKSGYIAVPGPNPITAGDGMRIYRVRKDYQNLTTSDPEVLRDAAELNEIRLEDVTVQQAQAVLDQYDLDWQEWPATLGAPYYDNNSNGIYEPAIDEPGLASADQVLWFVTHDIVDSADVIYASPPIGLELQTTMWGYKGADDALADMTFQRYRIINKSGLQIDSMTITRFAAYSMGESVTNSAATDTLRNMMYAYKRVAEDQNYQEFGLAPPAFGYALLQGPVVPSTGDSATVNFKRRAGFRNLDMSSSAYWGQEPSHPNRWTEEGAQQYYGLMNGLDWVGSPWRYYPDDPPNPNNYIETRYPLSGDPVTGLGDIETPTQHYWGQRSMLLSSGSFTMQPGDTQEVVYSLMGGIGQNRIESIVELRKRQTLAAQLQKTLFRNIPTSANFSAQTIYTATQVNEVRFRAENQDATAMEMLLKTRNGFPITTLPLFDDGQHHDGVAGDGIWGNSWHTTPVPSAVSADLEVSYQQGFDFLWEDIETGITTSGPVRIKKAVIGSDNTNQDGVANPGENIRFTLEIENQGSFNYSSVRINQIKALQPSLVQDLKVVNNEPLVSNLPGNSAYFSPYNPSNPYFTLTVDTGFPPDDSLQLVYQITSLKGNIWTDTVSIVVEALPDEPLEFPMTTISGRTDGRMSYRIFDSTMLNGSTYRLTFNEENMDGELFYVLENTTSGDTLAQSRSFPDAQAHSTVTVDGFTIVRGTATVEDSVGAWQWSGGDRWLGGVSWGGRAFFNAADLGDRFFGSNISEGDYKDIRIVFDSTMVTNANVFRRDLGYAHAGLGTFPGAAYDIEDPAISRRLNIIFIEDANAGSADLMWNPDTLSGGREHLLIMDSDYDPATGGGYTQDGIIFGGVPALWALWPRVEDGYTFMQNPGKLELYVYNGIELGLIYEFTPAYPTGIDGELSKPLVFELAQNYPNPFNPVTTIKFRLPSAQKIRLQIYNVLGQKVATLLDDNLNAGSYSLRWEGMTDSGSRVGSGVYFYRVESGDFVKTRKMLLVR